MAAQLSWGGTAAPLALPHVPSSQNAKRTSDWSLLLSADAVPAGTVPTQEKEFSQFPLQRPNYLSHLRSHIG